MPRYVIDRYSEAIRQIKEVLKTEFLDYAVDGDGHVQELSVDFELTDEQIAAIERIIGAKLVRTE